MLFHSESAHLLSCACFIGKSQLKMGNVEISVLLRIRIWEVHAFIANNFSFRYIKLQNGLCALLISDLNYLEGAPSALSSEEEEEDGDESEEESDEDDDDSGAEIEDGREGFDDEDCDEGDEGEDNDGDNEDFNDPDDSELEELAEKEETRKRGCTEKQVCI